MWVSVLPLTVVVRMYVRPCGWVLRGPEICDTYARTDASIDHRPIVRQSESESEGVARGRGGAVDGAGLAGSPVPAVPVGPRSP